MFLRSKRQLPEMVRPPSHNDSPSSPMIASMSHATFDATTQQSSQATPTVGASYTETIGTTTPLMFHLLFLHWLRPLLRRPNLMQILVASQIKVYGLSIQKTI